MIDVDGIREVLKKAGIYRKENDKNFMCRCPYCGDHKDPDKFHLYISKSDMIPTAHCWYCQGAWPIKKILFDITGNKCDDLLVTEAVYKSDTIKEIPKNRIKKYIIPELKTFDFPIKTLYIKKRTNNNIDIEKIPNLIFDIQKFFKINNLDIKSKLYDWEIDLIQNSSVAFLSYHNTTLYCRDSNVKSMYPFRKIVLQNDPLNMLDYYCYDNGNINSDIIVLSEGIFDILGCIACDSLSLNKSARVYAAGCTFAYPELLKSVCLDFSIYQADLNILSDSDKQKYHYKKLISDYSYLFKNINIVYNQYGKDFGNFPQKAIKLY